MAHEFLPSLGAAARTWKVAAWVALPLAALAVYGVTIGHEFIANDSFPIQSNEQFAQGGSWRAVFLTDWFNRSGVGGIGYYRPVAKASLRLTCLLAGPNPAAFHLGNLVLHMLAASVHTALARKFLSHLAATFIGVLNEVHPSIPQAVSIVTAWPGQRSTASWTKTRPGKDPSLVAVGSITHL